MTTKFYFAGKNELKTSYGNQRSIAARDLGGDTLCIHDKALRDGCSICRMSGEALVLVAR